MIIRKWLQRRAWRRDPLGLADPFPIHGMAVDGLCHRFAPARSEAEVDDLHAQRSTACGLTSEIGSLPYGPALCATCFDPEHERRARWSVMELR